MPRICLNLLLDDVETNLEDHDGAILKHFYEAVSYNEMLTQQQL